MNSNLICTYLLIVNANERMDLPPAPLSKNSFTAQSTATKEQGQCLAETGLHSGGNWKAGGGGGAGRKGQLAAAEPVAQERVGVGWLAVVGARGGGAREAQVGEELGFEGSVAGREGPGVKSLATGSTSIGLGMCTKTFRVETFSGSEPEISVYCLPIYSHVRIIYLFTLKYAHM
jgi:hypothetical protein